jgi:hypothetical protein
VSVRPFPPFSISQALQTVLKGSEYDDKCVPFDELFPSTSSSITGYSFFIFNLLFFLPFTHGLNARVFFFSLVSQQNMSC